MIIHCHTCNAPICGDCDGGINQLSADDGIITLCDACFLKSQEVAQ